MEKLKEAQNTWIINIWGRENTVWNIFGKSFGSKKSFGTKMSILSKKKYLQNFPTFQNSKLAKPKLKTDNNIIITSFYWKTARRNIYNILIFKPKLE